MLLVFLLSFCGGLTAMEADSSTAEASDAWVHVLGGESAVLSEISEQEVRAIVSIMLCCCFSAAKAYQLESGGGDPVPRILGVEVVSTVMGALSRDSSLESFCRDKRIDLSPERQVSIKSFVFMSFIRDILLNIRALKLYRVERFLITGDFSYRKIDDAKERAIVNAFLDKFELKEHRRTMRCQVESLLLRPLCEGDASLAGEMVALACGTEGSVWDKLYVPYKNVKGKQ